MKKAWLMAAIAVGFSGILEVTATAGSYDCYLSATEDVFVVVYETRENGVKGGATKKVWAKAGERVYHQSASPEVYIGYTTEKYDNESEQMANLRQMKLSCSGGQEIRIP